MNDVWEAAKRWFGDGEIDVDLLVSMGAISKEEIISWYRREVLGE